MNCAGTGQDGEIQAGAAWPDSRFIDNGDGTVTDSLTGLEWSKDANSAGGDMVWQNALEYVKTLDTGGYSDWRLPNRNELRSLADYGRKNPALPQGNCFKNVQSSYYWSSTTNVSSLDPWVVNMHSGSVTGGYNPYTTFLAYVWPVRAGQCASCGSSTTTTTIAPDRRCPVEKVLGDNDPCLQSLRIFRDSRLARSALGRRIIDIYYNNAESINAALEHSPFLRTAAKRVLGIIRLFLAEK